MADAEPEQEARTIRLALGLDRGEQVVDRLLLPALAAEQFGAMVAQAKDVGGRMQPSDIDELGDRFFAQAFDVERTARNEMAQPLEPLRRADQAAGAADVDLAFLRDGFAAAQLAVGGKLKRLAGFVAGEVFDHLRDHVAGALDAHPVAYAQAEPGDLVAIVQRDVGDDHSADADRLQPPNGGELASAPDLNV